MMPFKISVARRRVAILPSLPFDSHRYIDTDRASRRRLRYFRVRHADTQRRLRYLAVEVEPKAAGGNCPLISEPELIPQSSSNDCASRHVITTGCFWGEMSTVSLLSIPLFDPWTKSLDRVCVPRLKSALFLFVAIRTKVHVQDRRRSP